MLAQVLALLSAKQDDPLACNVQVWQGPALDALAAWLGEDLARMEPRLRQQDAVQRFVSLFASYSQNADSEALARLLDPFLRIMKRSRKITVHLLHFARGISMGMLCLAPDCTAAGIVWTYA